MGAALLSRPQHLYQVRRCEALTIRRFSRRWWTTSRVRFHAKSVFCRRWTKRCHCWRFCVRCRCVASPSTDDLCIRGRRRRRIGRNWLNVLLMWRKRIRRLRCVWTGTFSRTKMRWPSLHSLVQPFLIVWTRRCRSNYGRARCTTQSVNI